MTRKVFFHEDSYCQIEILPADNLEHCQKEMDALNDYVDNNDETEGFDDIYTPEETPFPLKTLKISTQSFDSEIKKVAIPFDIVETGFGSYKEEYPQTKAFGLNEELVLFYDYEDDIIQNIWLVLEINNRKKQELAHQILSTLSKINLFLLVDWNCDAIIFLDDGLSIKNYLAELAE